MFDRDSEDYGPGVPMSEDRSSSSSDSEDDVMSDTFLRPTDIDKDVWQKFVIIRIV